MRPRNHWFFGLSILTATALYAPALCADEASHRTHRCVSYQVWGGSLQRPHDDRPWSDVYGDGRVARQRLQEILDDYSARGLLAAASDKPTGLRVVVFESRAPQLPVHPLTAAIDSPPATAILSVARQELPVNASIHLARGAILLAATTLHRIARHVRSHQEALNRATYQLKTSRRPAIRSSYVAKPAAHLWPSCSERGRLARASRRWQLTCSR